jgi:polysaccharide export outer membrane protein
MSSTRTRFPRVLPRILAMGLFLLLCACGGGGNARSVPAGSAAFAESGQMAAPDSSIKTGVKSNSADYRVGPQDLLEISVFQVPELSRTVRVNTGGEISLPLIGVVQAGGRTVQDVEGDIASKLTAKYLQNPQVSVFVKEFTSQRVTLEGAVTKPGIYPLTGKTSLLQTIAIGGGLTELADLQGVIVFRLIDGKKKAARFDLKQIRNGTAEDPEIFGDDIVVVEESNSKSMFSKIMKSLPLMGVFTFF